MASNERSLTCRGPVDRAFGDCIRIEVRHIGVVGQRGACRCHGWPCRGHDGLSYDVVEIHQGENATRAIGGVWGALGGMRPGRSQEDPKECYEVGFASLLKRTGAVGATVGISVGAREGAVVGSLVGDADGALCGVVCGAAKRAWRSVDHGARMRHTHTYSLSLTQLPNSSDADLRRPNRDTVDTATAGRG